MTYHFAAARIEHLPCELKKKFTVDIKFTIKSFCQLVITINCGKFWKRWEYQTTWPASWEIYMQIRKQQLELNMEQQTGSKQEKE